MKKYFLLCLFVVLGIFSLFLSPQVFAESNHRKLIAADILPQEGSWIVDPEVTKIGKNASRSGQLLDWTLKDYQWSSSASQESDANPLAGFWIVIQRIVYALFLVVILITSFILIVTRGKSLSAKRFLPRFLLAVILVTFSFSLIQFIYQFIDILQGFFLNNSHGEIISSKDLLYIGFNYSDFEGLRRFGASFDESAFMSLILVKFTAFTYYVMALLLIFRKILLWFFIVLSPFFPILLLFYPVRNTGKIWIGEFFRWVLYAPLFAIFLSGLVRLWESPSGLPLLFDFAGAQKGDSIYPTAVNILLGGPGQKIGFTNSVNLPDTFALYIVALIMLWAVIILPFILLQIFLDHMMSYNYQNNPLTKQITNLMTTRLSPPPKPLEPPPSPLRQPGGLARNIPFGRKFEVPSSTGLAREIPITVSQQVPTQVSTTRNIATSSTVSNLTQLSIPTMRDIARYEIQKRSQDTSRSSEVERTKKTLLQIANPTTLTTASDRERYQTIREKLRVASQKGDRFATNVLQAANTYNYFTSQQSASTTINQGIRNLATPERIVSISEKEKIEKIKEKIIKESREGNIVAKQVSSGLDQLVAEQTAILKQILQALSPSDKEKSTSDQYQLLRERLTTASNSGNTVATNVISSIEKSTSEQEVQNLFNTLIKAEKEGNPVAHEVLQEVEKQVSQTSSDRVEQTIKDASDKKDPLGMMVYELLHEQQKEQKAPISASAKLKSGVLPAVNRIQEVSFDDYEAVKKMWKENYKNLKTDEHMINRRDEIRNDIGHIQETISLLSSPNPQMVEQGMRQVSDILPFLLIGGFSQTEILTYLKAKLEAAKSTIEEMSEKDDEEDTLLGAERAAKHVAQTMTMKTQASLPTEHAQESESSVREVVNAQTMSSSAQNITSIFNQINLPVITLRDIVRFDQASDPAKKEPMVDAIRENLLNIDNPQRSTSVEEREKYAALHDQLVTEDKKGNPLAKVVLSSIEALKQQSNSNQLSADQLIAILHEQMVQSADGSTTAVSQIVNQHSAQDSLAQELKDNAEKWLVDIKEKTKEFLEKVSDPARLPTAVEQMQYGKLLERVSLASSNGNDTASYIIRSIREKNSEQEIVKIYQKIAQGAQNGDELSIYLYNSIYTASPQAKNSSDTLFEHLLSKQKTGDPFATSLLREIAKIARKSDSKKVTAMPLPKANRIQAVTLDDYEEIRKMWEENYSHLMSDTSKSQSEKEAILRKDAEQLRLVINLLLSTDPDQAKRGLDMVGQILPFLMLGGFSESEVVGYLKAKLSAVEAVQKNTNQQKTEFVERTKVGKPKEQEAVIDQP